MRSKFLKWFFIVCLLGSGTVYSAFILVLFPFAGRSGRYWLAAQWCRAMVAWMRWLPGVTCSVEGLEHLPDGPSILLCRHESTWETLAFLALFLTAYAKRHYRVLGVALAMLVDATMLYRLFGSRAFPAEGAWPPGVAAAEAIFAGDAGGRRVLVLGGGVLLGIIGTGLLNIPMSAFGVAFIGNVWALVMFGVGLLVRGYSSQLFSGLIAGGDISKAYIPHGLMIGAGVVALVQVGMVMMGDHGAGDGTKRGQSASLGLGAVAYVIVGVLIALGGGLVSELSPKRTPLLASSWVFGSLTGCSEVFASMYSTASL